MDSWFTEIPIPRTWRVYLATGFDFRGKKSCLFWVDRSPDAGFRLLPCHYIMKEGERDHFPRNFVYVLKTTTAHHMVSFIDFYYHFLANFQT